MRGQREATRASRHVAHDDDGGLSSGSETGSASGASGGGGSSGAVPSRHDARSAGSSEGAAERDPSYGEVPGSGGSCGSPQELSLEDIQSCFSLGLREAAARLGVCATTLKRHCRKHSIWKWPNRELKKYNRALAEIQRLQSDSGARLPLPAALAAASGGAAQGRSQGSGGTQEADEGATWARPPRSTATTARRQRTNRRQAKGTAAEAAAPASPVSVRTHSDRTVGRRQPPTPEISDVPSMLGAATAWTASESGTPSLNATRTGQCIEDQQLAAAGAQRSVTHDPVPQQWPPPLPPSPHEHAGSIHGARFAAGDETQLLGLHRHQAAMAVQHAVAQGHWPGMQHLTQEALTHLQQALPQGGLGAGGGPGAWPLDVQPGDLNPGAPAPASLESHVQQWQRQAAQEPSFGRAERSNQRGRQPPQPQHWSLSGATEARLQPPPQPPASLQGWQEQLVARSGWEYQADEQHPSQQQEQAQDLMRTVANLTEQQLAGLAAAQGFQQARLPQGSSPTAAAQAQQLMWEEIAKRQLGPGAALGAVPDGDALQGTLPSAGAWMASSAPALEGHPSGQHCQALPAPALQLPANHVFRPFETAHEGLSICESGGPMLGSTGQPDAWLSRTSAPDDAGGLLPEGRFRQPAGLGGGLPELGFGGVASHGLRHATGSIDGLVATFLPPSTELGPESPSI